MDEFEKNCEEKRTDFYNSAKDQFAALGQRLHYIKCIELVNLLLHPYLITFYYL